MPSDPVIHALAGGAAGCLAMSLTYPLVVVSTRRAVAKREENIKSIASSATPQNSFSESICSLPSTVLNDLKSAGVAISNLSPSSIKELGGLYAGLGSSLIGIAVTNTVFYLFCESSMSSYFLLFLSFSLSLFSLFLFRSFALSLFLSSSLHLFPSSSLPSTHSSLSF